MGETQTLILGFIAGVTIMLGLPLGRLRSPNPALSQLLNAFAIGILVFLLWDVLTHAWEPVDSSLAEFHEGEGGLRPVVAFAALFVSGLGIGLASLVVTRPGSHAAAALSHLGRAQWRPPS